MRSLAILALVFLAAAAPPSIPPDLASSPAMVAAEHQAEALLKPCKTLGLSHEDTCTNNQISFVQQYVRALSGRADAAGAIASDFSPVDRAHCNEKPMCRRYNHFAVGLPVDQVSACAWRAVTLALQNPKQEFLISLERQSLDDDCSVLSMVELLRAKDHAVALIRRIADHPIALPSPGWSLPWSDFASFEAGH